MPDSDDSKNASTSTFWDFLKNAVLFLGIFLFFIGWVDLYFYFGNFGLSVLTVKIEIFTYYIYGFNVLIKLWSAIVAVLYLAALSLIYFKMERNRGCYYLITLLLISLFPVYLGLARYYSIEGVRSLLHGAAKSNPVFISFKQKEKKSGNTWARPAGTDYMERDSAQFHQLLGYMQDYRLREFFRTEGEIYYFVNPNVDDSKELPILIYIFNKDEISYVTKFIDQQNLLSK
jgi:hypothetical protein